MRKPGSVRGLEEFGRVRLSHSFQMREFLHSEIAEIHRIANIPDDPDLAVAVGTRLCSDLLEPLNDRFGRIIIRSAYRSAAVNAFGNAHKLNCASNEADRAGHIWDLRDADGHMGATACIVIPRLAGEDWRGVAWWIHDHLPYSHLQFFAKLNAFNIQWHDKPRRRIDSYIAPRGCLTKRGMANQTADHSRWYADFP